MRAPAIAKVPCVQCPFRKDVPIFLRRERRAEIARSLVEGATFPCHKTVDYDVDEAVDPDVLGASECAGAAKSLLLVGGSTQSMRIAERLGLADLDALEATSVEVWGLTDWQRLAEGTTGADPVEDEDEILTCSIVDEGCIAPAGYGGFNGGVALGTEPADAECSVCAEPVCSACLPESGVCTTCEWPEDDS